jgi:PPP family 3-phenylpropionic acid transporter
LLVLLACIWVASLIVPERAAGHLRLDHEPLRNILRRPVVVALLVVCFLMQASHGPYYTFFSIFLEDQGYSRTVIGQLWALGVIAEIVVFLFMYRLLPRYGVRNLLLASLALTTLRWLLIAWFVEDVPIVVLAQTFHAASFGIYHAVAISLIHRFFTGRHQGKGQALYSSLSFGAGGAIGSLYSGYTWGSIGPSFTYTLAAVLSAVAFMVAWAALRNLD